MVGSPLTIYDHHYNHLQTVPTNIFTNHILFLERKIKWIVENLYYPYKYVVLYQWVVIMRNFYYPKKGKNMFESSAIHVLYHYIFIYFNLNVYN